MTELNLGPKIANGILKAIEIALVKKCNDALLNIGEDPNNFNIKPNPFSISRKDGKKVTKEVFLSLQKHLKKP